jgi:hypothetical protein
LGALRHAIRKTILEIPAHSNSCAVRRVLAQYSIDGAAKEA